MSTPTTTKKRLAYVAADGSRQALYVLPEDRTAQEIATSRGWTDEEWGVLEIGDFGGNEDYFGTCWIIGPYHSVTFDLEKARAACIRLMQVGTRLSEAALRPYAVGFLVAQSTLAVEDRLPEVQALFDAENDLAAQFVAAKAAILQATNPGDLWNLASPWIKPPQDSEPF